MFLIPHILNFIENRTTRGELPFNTDYFVKLLRILPVKISIFNEGIVFNIKLRFIFTLFPQKDLKRF